MLDRELHKGTWSYSVLLLGSIKVINTCRIKENKEEEEEEEEEGEGEEQEQEQEQEQEKQEQEEDTKSG